MNEKVDMFDYFANIAKKSISGTEKVGRYAVMKEKEKNIFPDILEKLKLSSKSSILDIGCGCGTVVNDLINYFIKNRGGTLVFNDSLEVLNQIKSNFGGFENIEFISGRFPDIELDKNQKFDAIILYSVLHYVDKKNIYSFIDSILDRLDNRGSFLIGDIPNMDKRKRFDNSNFGQEFNEQWGKKRTSCFISENYPSLDLSFFNDDLIFNIIKYIRKKGDFNAYLLPQSNKLPFGYIRDDILVERL